MRPCCTYKAWRVARQFSSEVTKDVSHPNLASSTPKRRSKGNRGLLGLLGQVKKDVQAEVLASNKKAKYERLMELARARKVHRPLPLSPLMDPSKIAARQRHLERKARAPEDSDLTPFQRKLARNPYGMVQ